MNTYYTHVLDKKPSTILVQDRIYLAEDVDKEIAKLWKRIKALENGRLPRSVEENHCPASQS